MAGSEKLGVHERWCSGGGRILSVQVFEVRQHKYVVLLALLVVALALETFGAQSGVERLRSDALRAVVSVVLWIVVFENPGERRVMAAILIALLAITFGRYFTAPSLDQALLLSHAVLLSLLLWSAVYVILQDLFRAPAAGTESLLGAICGYVISGSAWGQLNAIAYLLVPSAYSINPELAGFLHGWHNSMALFTYYAFAQQTTIGYSDVTPLHAPATTLSLLATLFGVFYTAVVVSQFVSLAQNLKRETPTDQ
jgi:Ion channel